MDEDHIKYEAEESAHLADHVWEEVVIEDDVASWAQDVEMEGGGSGDITMESTASESTEFSTMALNPLGAETPDNNDEETGNIGQETGNIGQETCNPTLDSDKTGQESGNAIEETGTSTHEYGNTEQETGNAAQITSDNALESNNTEKESGNTEMENGDMALESGSTEQETSNAAQETGDLGVAEEGGITEFKTEEPDEVNTTIAEDTEPSTSVLIPQTNNTTTSTQSPTGSLPIVTNVHSLSSPPKKVIKILPKGTNFINIGNKKMKLVPLTGDQKVIAGKLVSMGGNSPGKSMISKVITLGGSPQKRVAKVVTVGGNNSSANIVNNKLLPAKVVSMNHPKLQPIAPAPSKEVTIYITGLAGDKVHIKDNNVPISKMQIGDRVQLAQREVTYDDEDDDEDEDDYGNWRSGLSSEHVETVVVTPNMVSDGQGHFLLDTETCDVANLTCNICERQFSQLKYLLSHQQTHILSEPVACDQCGKRFKRRYDLLRHQRRAHDATTLYECEVCHKTFTERAAAERHRMLHSDEFKFACEVCSRPFRYVHDLKRHRSIHFDEKPFECEVCSKRFKHKSNLKTHQATHYSEKPYSCTLCDKRFHQKGNLKTHLIVHTGEMPFVCGICTKRFHTRSGLLNHSYSHSDEKPFQCEICEKTFNWKSGLLTHQQTHRQRVIQEQVEVIEIGPIHVDPDMVEAE